MFSIWNVNMTSCFFFFYDRVFWTVYIDLLLIEGIHLFF